jgi:MFS family permease
VVLAYARALLTGPPGTIGHIDADLNDPSALPALSQILSAGGDRLALVALALLVYDRTRSPLLAAIAYAAGTLPYLIGALFLSGLADRFPRREVTVTCDVVRAALVAAMLVPRMPLEVLIALLYAVTAFQPPFDAARSAILRDMVQGGREHPAYSLAFPGSGSGVDDLLGVGGLDVLARDRVDDRGGEPLAQPPLGVGVLAGPPVLGRQPVRVQVMPDQVRAGPLHVRRVGLEPLPDLLQLLGQLRLGRALPEPALRFSLPVSAKSS